MVRSFDKSKLSAGGFYVDVDKSDITLPNGTVISSGLDFRNTFHVNPLASAGNFFPPIFYYIKIFKKNSKK